MNPKFQLQISIVNYSESNHTINREVTLEEIAEFSQLFKAVVLNGNVTTWNWWNHLPDTWNGEKYVDNDYIIASDFKKNFGMEVPVEIIKKFYKKFVVFGDRLDNIKLFKVEEVELP